MYCSLRMASALCNFVEVVMRNFVSEKPCAIVVTGRHPCLYGCVSATSPGPGKVPRLGAFASAASEAALAWASWLRWPGELQALPLASSERGRLHALCLAHMQGPAAKELFLEEGRSHRRFPWAGRATEAGRAVALPIRASLL